MRESNPTEIAALASAVPFRFSDSGLEFCLITTRKSGRWGFPKGRIGKQQTARETALAEALEEAGLEGGIVGDPLGKYRCSRKGQSRSVLVWLMKVEDCLEEWDESAERDRRWVSPGEAQQLLNRPVLNRLLRAAVDRIATT